MFIKLELSILSKNEKTITLKHHLGVFFSIFHFENISNYTIMNITL